MTVVAFFLVVGVSVWHVPSSAMEPVLGPVHRAWTLADWVPSGWLEVDRGDVVIARPPTSETFASGEPTVITRVVALEGERIGSIDGELTIDGEVIADPGSHPGAVTHLSESILVPRGSVFVMGDNRMSSLDSRVYGPLPESAIVAEVVWVGGPAFGWVLLVGAASASVAGSLWWQILATRREGRFSRELPD